MFVTISNTIRPHIPEDHNLDEKQFGILRCKIVNVEAIMECVYLY
jgi:hypothetical protein